MALENRVVLTTSIVVDIDADEHGNSPRMELIQQKLLDAIDAAFASDGAVQPTSGIAFDWLNDPRTNFGRCVDCNRLASDYRQPHRIAGLLAATVINGQLLCDECQYLRRENR